MAMFCPDCQQNLDDVKHDSPCPQCGGRRRSALVEAGVALAVATAFSPTVSIGYNPSPGWPYEWRIIQRHLARLREQYQGKRMEGNEDVEENVHALFLALSHLYDWLYQDSSTSLTSQVVKAWIDSHPNSLAICRDYANTFKHMKRQSANAIAAQIARIESGPSGQTVAIGYRPSGQPNAAMTEVDGLDLAERSEQDWRGLLSLYGIAIPS